MRPSNVRHKRALEKLIAISRSLSKIVAHRAIDEVTNVLVERLLAVAVEELTSAVGQPPTEFSLQSMQFPSMQPDCVKLAKDDSTQPGLNIFLLVHFSLIKLAAHLIDVTS